MTAAADVRLWVWRADEAVPAGLLSEAEEARAARFHNPRDVAWHRGSHAGLRLILGHVTGEAPSLLRFTQGVLGKPALTGAAAGWEFSLSHAGGFAAVAVATFPLGLDIEAPRRVDKGVARLLLGPAELADLATVPPALRQGALLAAWTRKEAVGKAMGCGLDMALDQLRVTVLPDATAALLDIGWAPGEAPRWHLVALRAAGCLVGTIAAARRGWRPLPGDAAALAPMRTLPWTSSAPAKVEPTRPRRVQPRVASRDTRSPNIRSD